MDVVARNYLRDCGRRKFLHIRLVEPNSLDWRRGCRLLVCSHRTKSRFGGTGTRKGNVEEGLRKVNDCSSS